MFPTPFVTAETGGRGGGGAALTPLGREVVKRFRAMEAASWSVIEPDFRRLSKQLRKPPPAKP